VWPNHDQNSFDVIFYLFIYLVKSDGRPMWSLRSIHRFTLFCIIDLWASFNYVPLLYLCLISRSKNNIKLYFKILFKLDGFFILLLY